VTVRRSFLNWGVFLICLGAVPLAVQLGTLDADVAADLLRLWPLILIGIGLGLLARLTPYAAIGGIIVAATVGLLLGVVITGGAARGGAIACSGTLAGGPSIVRSGSFAGVSSTVSAELTCADVEVARATGSGWTVDVVSGDEEPTISATDSSLTLRSRQGVGPFSGDREVWRITLPSDTALGGSFTFNAARADLDLGDGAVAGVSVTYNAVDALLDLSGATGAPSLSATLNATSLDLLMPEVSASGDLTLNAASLNVCTAPGTSVRIDFEETLGSNNFSAAGLQQNGRVWQSPDYATAVSRIDLRMTANASSVTLNPAGGCQ
jgi:hypothetical protein